MADDKEETATPRQRGESKYVRILRDLERPAKFGELRKAGDSSSSACQRMLRYGIDCGHIAKVQAIGHSVYVHWEQYEMALAAFSDELTDAEIHYCLVAQALLRGRFTSIALWRAVATMAGEEAA